MKEILNVEFKILNYKIHVSRMLRKQSVAYGFDLADIWNLLNSITRIHFRTQSGFSSGWNEEGYGTVTVQRPDENVLVFDEQGEWRSSDGRSFAFKNTYRWTLISSGLHLEHLRQGIHNPVFLVEFQPINQYRWDSIKPHICGKDLYSGVLNVHNNEIELKWTVRGPKKCETLLNIYS